MTCEVCDREGCPAQSFKITDDESAACSAILKFRGRVEDDVRDLARAASRRCAEADRDCAAHAVHAVVWRDLAIAARAREAALTAEVERLTDAVGDEARARREAEATARSAESANRIMQAENARLMVALSSAESSRDGWKAVAEVRTRDLAAARADAANARAVAEAACDLADGAIDNAPPSDSRDDGDLSSIAAGHALVATLRAQLASPGPAKET